MPYKDPEKRKTYHKEQGRKYYLANKDKVLAGVKVQRAIGKARWDTFKRTLKCTKCKQNHPAALDFLHIDPSEKENLVSKLVSNGCFAAAMEEVQKCIVLCANCHRIHHYEENSAKMQALTTNLLPEHAGQR
jgi:hypothetical protein